MKPSINFDCGLLASEPTFQFRLLPSMNGGKNISIRNRLFFLTGNKQQIPQCIPCEVRSRDVNLYEVCYDAARTSGNQHAVAEILETVRQLPIVIVWEINDEMLQAAAMLKVRYRISLADSFALGLVTVLDAEVVSADHHEFDPVVQAGDVSVLWFR